MKQPITEEEAKEKLDKIKVQFEKATQDLAQAATLEATLAAAVQKSAQARDQLRSKVDAAERDINERRNYILGKIGSKPSSAQQYIKALMASRYRLPNGPAALRKINKRTEKKNAVYRAANKKSTKLKERIVYLNGQTRFLNSKLEHMKNPKVKADEY